MNKYKKGFAHVIFLVIGVLVLIAAIGTTIALVHKYGGAKEGTPAVQNNVSQNQTNDWKTYSNNEMGFSFSYPTSWGEIREYSTLGYYDWYKNTNNPSNQCINLFLSAQNFGTNSQFVNFFKSEPCPAPRDGSYFESSWIKDQKTIDGFCKVYTSNANIDSCTVTKNKNDITFARLSYKDVPKMDSDTGFGPYIFYYMYSPNASRGMAFVAKPENAAVMDKVVDSLRFTSISTNLGANWKKYQSEKYGFELSYPSTWVIKTDPQMEGWVGFSPADKHDDSPTGGSVKVEDNVKGLTLNGLFEEVKKIPYYYGFEFFYVSGEQALQYRSNEFAATRAVVVHGGKIYTLGNEIVTNAKILSSFRFTDKSETADWKTYRNEKYGYELKYPPYLNIDTKQSTTGGIDISNSQAVEFNLFPLDKPQTNENLLITVVVQDDLNSKNLDGLFKYIKDSYRGATNYNYQGKIIKVGSMDAIYTPLDQVGEMGSGQLYVFFHNNKDYVITFTDSKDSKRNADMGLMMQSFKFTN